MVLARGEPLQGRQRPERPEERGLYETLRDDILALAISPGADLEESALAEQYGVSRTPIREVLIRLAADGLVEVKSRRGARVIPIILPNLPRFLEALSLVQRALCRVAASRRLTRDLSHIRSAVTAFQEDAALVDVDDYSTAMQVANAEHDVLAAVAGAAHNAYLLEAFERLHLKGQRMLRMVYAYRPAGTEPVSAYAGNRLDGLLRLEAAVREGDGEKAEREGFCLHTQMSERLTAYFAENLTEDVAIEARLTGEQPK